MEEFRKAFEDYEISNLGNCRRKNNIIKGSIQNRGYRYFQVQRDDKRINLLFHHLVAKCFLGERPEDFVIDHIDRNKLNNNVENLRYVTQKENLKNQDRYRDDILDDDPKIRRRLFQKEYRVKTGKNRGIRRTIGTGGITERCGSYRAMITIDGVAHRKTCKTKEEAEEYLKSFI
jgi:hypothetical protein